MKQLIRIAALAGALVGAAGPGFAQQQPAPDATGQPTTCSQTADFCRRACEPHAGQGTRQCLLHCDTTLAECKVTGFWKNLSTGQMLPRRKE
jgi:hypothetical protein